MKAVIIILIIVIVILAILTIVFLVLWLTKSTTSGLSQICNTTSDCAAGLVCQSGVCICYQPLAPTGLKATLGAVNGSYTTVTFTWNSSLGSGWYNILINGPTVITATKQTGTNYIADLASGNYNIKVVSVSGSCGSGESSPASLDFNVP